MKLIDTGYDELLKSNYELISFKFKELKEEAKSWYGDINFRKFDERPYMSGRDEDNLIEAKKSGLICNLFFAYREDNNYYLMDGFNRLFTDYANIDVDCTVYLKVLTDKLEDHQLMKIMFHLNTWKLYSSNIWGYKVSDFFDRGMKLFINKKFGIEIYTRETQWDKETRKDNYEHYVNREIYEDDMCVLPYYFKNECKLSDYAFQFDGISILFGNINIINDLKEIISVNKYKQQEFKNFTNFFKGYIMFLAWRRVLGDDGEHKFETYLNLLKEDKKFFKKLQGMCGNDSTRINIYHFFRGLYKKD